MMIKITLYLQSDTLSGIITYIMYALPEKRIHMLKKIALATIATVALFAATPALATDYLANTKSGKFHYATCRTIKHPDAPHFVPYSSRE